MQCSNSPSKRMDRDVNIKVSQSIRRIFLPCRWPHGWPKYVGGM